MTPLLPSIHYGQRDFPLSEAKEVPRRGALDTIEQTWQTSVKDKWEVDDGKAGRVSRFPKRQTMFIDEIDKDPEAPGVYIQRIKGLGLLNGRDKIISKPVSNPEEGFDTGEIELLTLTPERFQPKRPHPDVSTLFITDCAKEIEIGTITRVRAGYKGIVPVDGLPKGYKRRYSTSSSAQQTKDKVFIYHRILYEGEWIWANEPVAYNYQLDSSRVQVTDSFLSEVAPVLDSIPGNWQPPNTPDELHPIAGVTLLQPPGQTVITNDEMFVKNRPFGWVLRSLSAEQIWDLPVYLYTMTGEWVPELEVKI